MSAAENKAVFLSYASQDAAAVQRIAEALRASGVEVWFDQNELVGGDAWDQKIRNQIKACALFVPVISAATQARLEGYFRLEWKLAAQRTHTMADAKPFLLPVVIDATRDAEAHVPEEFRAVQWTRLAGGETPPAFCARVKKLLGGESGTGILPVSGQHGQDARATKSPAPSRAWLIPAIVGLAASITIFIWQPWKKPAAPAPPAEAAATAEGPAGLIRQARTLIYDPDSARNEFALAEGMLKRATDLAPDSAAALGASALLNHYFVSRGYDPAEARLVRSRADAENALRLDAHNVDALLALGLHRQGAGETESARQFLAQARAADPRNPKVAIAQALLIPAAADRVKFLVEAAARVAQPAEVYYYASVDLIATNRLDEARLRAEQAIQAQPFWRAYVHRTNIEYVLTCDPARMAAFLDQVPELKRDEPRVVIFRWRIAMIRRDGVAAAQALTAAAGAYLEDNFFTGPKSFLLAHAHELAGLTAPAAEQWQLATLALREKLAAIPGDSLWRAMLAVSLAAQHADAEARAVADACAADARLDVQQTTVLHQRWREVDAMEYLAEAYVRLGDLPRAVAMLRRNLSAVGDVGVSPAILRADPRWQPLRGQRDFEALLVEFRNKGLAGDGAPTPAAADKSVAVLAFENLSDDKANEYFSDGIADELLTTLQKIPGLRVAARTSAFSFKGKHATAQEVGAKLGMAHIVEGTVQKSGNRVKITARLSRAATNEEVWSKSFGPLELTDVFATQSELAQAIVAELRGRLAGEPAAVQADVAAAQRGGTRNAEAHALYLQGKFLAAQYSRESVLRATASFQQAVKLDPEFALAWAALAATTTSLGNFNYVALERTPAEAVAEARRAAEQSLALEPRLAEGHMALTLTQWWERDWKAARASAQRALELAPSDAAALASVADAANLFRDYERALELAQRAVALDPISPGVRYSLVSAYWDQGKLPEAEAEIRRLLALNPDAINNNLMLAVLVVLQGRPDEAAAIVERETDEVNRNVGFAFVRWGQKRMPEADAALKFVIEHAADRVAFQIAEIYGYRREVEQAFAWLARADRQRDVGLTYTRTDLFLEPLRHDPRWPVLLKKIGLSDEQLK